MPSQRRIDVHQHVLPPFWVDGLRERGSVHRPPTWSPQRAIDYMDSRQIDTAVLSLTAPGLSDWAADQRVPMARRINEYTAGLVIQWPGRFGNFATLPLPDISAALDEVAYALDTLGADGVVLYSNYGDRFLGDPVFEPLWAELDRRHAVAFIHPTRTSLPELDGIPAPFVDFPFATTRTAVDMVVKGVLDRHSQVRIILSHGGGYLPYVVQRVVACVGALPADTDERALDLTFRRFHLDTALSSGSSSLPSLISFADPSRILFGSDFPYAPGGTDEQFTATLDRGDLKANNRSAINRRNAVELFGRGGWPAAHADSSATERD